MEKTFEQYFQLLPPTENQKSYSIGQILEYKVRWETSGRWKWIRGDYIIGKTSVRRGIGKILEERYWARSTVALGRTTYLKYPVHPKTYSSDLNSTLDSVYFPPRTNLKPWLTVRKPINSPVLSPTLLQIYCIGLIGPISYFFWIWATICDPTVAYQWIVVVLLMLTYVIKYIEY